MKCKIKVAQLEAQFTSNQKVYVLKTLITVLESETLYKRVNDSVSYIDYLNAFMIICLVKGNCDCFNIFATFFDLECSR